MFDKIVLIDNKIALVKYIIEWKEKVAIGIDESGKEQFRIESHSDWAVSEADKERVIQAVAERNIEYSITTVDIPESIQAHDNELWNKGRDEAILYVNDVGEYSPLLVEINRLKGFLNNDWRWRQERNVYEQKEILLGLRETTTEKEEDLVRERANTVASINKLEEELNL